MFGGTRINIQSDSTFWFSVSFFVVCGFPVSWLFGFASLLVLRFSWFLGLFGYWSSWALLVHRIIFTGSKHMYFIVEYRFVFFPTLCVGVVRFLSCPASSPPRPPALRAG